MWSSLNQRFAVFQVHTFHILMQCATYTYIVNIIERDNGNKYSHQSLLDTYEICRTFVQTME